MLARKSLERLTKDYSTQPTTVEVGFAVNVDSTMDNRFILSPTNEIVLNADKLYSVEHSVIHIGIEDVKAIIDTAENVIILRGNALGKM